MRKRTFSPLTILLVMLFVIGCQFPTGSATSQSVDKISSPTSLPTLTVVASTPTLPPEILEVSYDSLARETEQYVGKMVHYYGEIVQVIEGNDLEAVLRVNVTKNTYGWQDTVWINYEGPRLLEDDLIEVWGVVVGRRTYESIFGASITVPEIDAVTLERVAITVSSGLGTLAPQDTDEPTKGTASNPATIGEVLTFGNLSLCVLGWGEIDETGRSIGPDDGYRWIYVDVVMLNQGESSTDVSISTSVRDDTGHSFDASPSLMHSGSWWDEALNGRLEPDEQVRDRIGYEVLVDAEDLVFVFSSDWISGKTFVALGDEPAFIELPQQVVGENVIGSAFSMGEKINAGTLSIVVNDVSLYQQYGRTGYGDPDPGFQYLVADLTFTNEGQQEISLDPDDDLWVKDNLCRKYMSDWTAEIWLDTQDFQDTLTPGEMSRGQIAYQVAADAESFVLVFTPDSSETSKLFVNLQ